MINKNISIINEEDIIWLKTNGIPEGKTIEYKSELSISTDKGKWEFLADISSFANTKWWDIIYWVNEEEWLISDIVWLDDFNTDTTLQKINHLIQFWIDPRINIDVHKIDLNSSKKILLIRINKSLIWPHRVIFTWHSKTKDQFYKRNTSGKYQLDVNQLREDFTLSYNLTHKIKTFKKDRIALIINDETPSIIDNPWKIILHMIPLDFSRNQHDIRSITNKSILLPTMRESWRASKINLEWFLSYSTGEQKYFYTQLFRDWTIEAIDWYTLRWSKNIPVSWYEKMIIDKVNTYKDILQEIGVNCPIYVFITLLDVKWFRLWLPWDRIWHDNEIEKDIIEFPEVVIENFSDNISKILRSSFDLLWNACWLKKSFNYDKNWEWTWECDW